MSSVKVWDPFVRLFHWGLVASFIIAWITADDWDTLHHWAGYAAAALIGLRLVWGLIGPRYARFTQFIKSPAATIGYLSDIIRGRERRYIGHNPAGAAMVMVLIVAMLGCAFTGWLYTTDAFWGSDWVEETHETLANGLLILVLVHIAGVLLASLRHHENLVRAMITGKKRRALSDDIG